MTRTVEIRGREFRFVDETSHTGFLFDLIERDEWEPDTFDVIEEFVHGGTFVDVGAHVGVLSVYASTLADRVVALEPDPVAREMLHRNLDLNGITNVEVLARALWSSDGPVSLFTCGELGDSMTGPTREGAERVVDGVSVATLRTLVPSPDLVKVDTEGSEGEFAADLVEWGCPVYLSVHEDELTRPLPEWSREHREHGGPPYYALLFP